MGDGFVTDSLASSRHVRVLTVVDMYTRECLALETDTSIGSLRVPSLGSGEEDRACAHSARKAD